MKKSIKYTAILVIIISLFALSAFLRDYDTIEQLLPISLNGSGVIQSTGSLSASGNDINQSKNTEISSEIFEKFNTILTHSKEQKYTKDEYGVESVTISLATNKNEGVTDTSGSGSFLVKIVKFSENIYFAKLTENSSNGRIEGRIYFLNEKGGVLVFKSFRSEKDAPIYDYNRESKYIKILIDKPLYLGFNKDDFFSLYTKEKDTTNIIYTVTKDDIAFFNNSLGHREGGCMLIKRDQKLKNDPACSWDSLEAYQKLIDTSKNAIIERKKRLKDVFGGIKLDKDLEKEYETFFSEYTQKSQPEFYQKEDITVYTEDAQFLGKYEHFFKKLILGGFLKNEKFTSFFKDLFGPIKSDYSQYIILPVSLGENNGIGLSTTLLLYEISKKKFSEYQVAYVRDTIDIIKDEKVTTINTPYLVFLLSETTPQKSEGKDKKLMYHFPKKSFKVYNKETREIEGEYELMPHSASDNGEEYRYSTIAFYTSASECEASEAPCESPPVGNYGYYLTQGVFDPQTGKITPYTQKMQEKIDEGGGGNSWIVFREKIGDIRIGMMESIDLGYECHSKMTENQIDFDCDKKAQTFRTFLYSSIVNPIDLYYEIIGSYLGVAKSWEDLSPEEKKETKIQTQEERNNPDYPYNSETCKKQDACNLLTAYNLKYQPKESFEKFFETYKDVMNVKILSREILPDDTFKVQVELEMIQNEEKERYEVVIKIIEGRLQTISSKRVK